MKEPGHSRVSFGLLLRSVKGVYWQPVGSLCRLTLVVSSAVYLPDREIELNATHAQDADG